MTEGDYKKNNSSNVQKKNYNTSNNVEYQNRLLILNDNEKSDELNE